MSRALKPLVAATASKAARRRSASSWYSRSSGSGGIVDHHSPALARRSSFGAIGYPGNEALGGADRLAELAQQRPLYPGHFQQSTQPPQRSLIAELQADPNEFGGHFVVLGELLTNPVV